MKSPLFPYRGVFVPLFEIEKWERNVLLLYPANENAPCRGTAAPVAFDQKTRPACKVAYGGVAMVTQV